MNKLILMGRLTRDPEIRYSQGATPTAVANFSLAVDRKFKRSGDSVTADFFNCAAFGKQAEFAEKYLKQGTKILLTGRLQNNNYTDKNGNKIFGVQVITEEMEFAESKKAAEDAGYMPESHPSMDTDQPPLPRESDGFINVPDDLGDDELPFN